MAYKRNQYHGSIRAIWGLAKSPELMLEEDILYAIIRRETKKESMRQLSQSEIDNVCRILQNMKDDVTRANKGKRTDEGGNTETERLRKKVYALTEELGWNDNNNRINGFVMKMFKVSRIEWLTYAQCNKLIEILKKMIDRQEAEKANGSKEKAETPHQ
ncbi:regulatory protein GemA [Tissierella carlieri]|uniref:Regulatory protein GemA n=1 Tax=Tissierella carlieri TaxID=689904 RepID=A0ABT1SCS0_9FIRM|nr:regulatory protein GemA [Tissierella carlieri]MCQ4924105.1 regulatory protein GemA [Tissierella carlieri]